MKSILIILQRVLLIFLLFNVLNDVTAQNLDIDPSFNVVGRFKDASGTSYALSTLALQPDGKVLAYGGNFTEFNGAPISSLFRLNQDGTIDPSFNSGISFTFSQGIAKIIVQSDGKIIIGGNFTNYKGTSFNNIARLNADGSVDNTFNIGTGFDNGVGAMELLEDGKILVVGGFSNFNGSPVNRVARLNADGTLDNTFANSLTALPANVRTQTVRVQVDGKILLGMSLVSFETYNQGVIRLNADGTMDNTFNVTIGDGERVDRVAIQQDGKIIIAGFFSTVNGTAKEGMARLNMDGSLDTSFTGSIGKNGNLYFVHGLEIFGDGKMMVTGNFNVVNQKTQASMALLNVDGSTNNTLLAATNGLVREIRLDGNDKIYGVGGVISEAGIRVRLFHLAPVVPPSSGGEVDPSFDPEAGADGVVRLVVFQDDGKIIMGGSFTMVNNTPRKGIARLNADGSLDTSFDPGTGTDNSVFAIFKQSDGKIIIGGDFTTYNGNSANGLVRLNADGSIDNTFNIGTGIGDATNPTVFAIREIPPSASVPELRILIGGAFLKYNGQDAFGFAFIKPDGTFIPRTTLRGETVASARTSISIKVIQTVGLQSDGKIILGGSTTAPSFNSNQAQGRNSGANQLQRINSNGTLDNTFATVTVDNTIQTIVLQSDGKILIGGSFTTVNGTARAGIARINSDGSLDASFNPGSGITGGSPSTINVISIQANGQFIIGGDFTSINDVVRQNIARLNSNGSVDTSFDPGSGTNAPVQAIAVQADGKVLVGGAFTMVNGSSKMGLVRFGNTTPTLITYGSGNRITFGDPCACDDLRNCQEGSSYLFHDTLRIPATGTMASGLDIRVSSSSNFFVDVSCFGGTLTAPTNGASGTPILETSAGSGVYKIEFWRPSGAQPTLSVTESSTVTTAPATTFQPICTFEACNPQEPIPTMSEWGLMIFGLLVLNLGVFFIQRKAWVEIN